MLSDEELDDWVEFVGEVGQKMQRGAREGNNAASDMLPDQVLREIKDECLDLAGWGFVLWRKVRQMERSVGNG